MTGYISMLFQKSSTLNLIFLNCPLTEMDVGSELHLCDYVLHFLHILATQSHT
jgi:hypothetical protein